MLRPSPRPTRSPFLRNLTAILVAFGAVSVLYFSTGGLPADASFAENEEQLVARLSAVNSEPQCSVDSAERNAPGEVAGESDAPLIIEGREALSRNLELLKQALEKLSRIPDYTATMFTHERVGGQMTPAHVIQLKLRHEPFSLYMKWLAGDDKGREVIYVDGRDDNEMLVKLGGLKGRLLPAIKIDPNGSLARSKSRHAITEAGLLNLVRQLLEHRQHDLNDDVQVGCRMTDGHKFDERPCCRFVLEFADREESPTYRKSIQFFDEEFSVPVCIRNYGWPREGREIAPADLDEATLLEHYTYSDIRFHQRLADRDFDRNNAKYAFR